MRTRAHVGEIWTPERHHGLVLLSLVRSLVFDRQALKSLLRPPKAKPAWQDADAGSLLLDKFSLVSAVWLSRSGCPSCAAFHA